MDEGPVVIEYYLLLLTWQLYVWLLEEGDPWVLGVNEWEIFESIFSC